MLAHRQLCKAYANAYQSKLVSNGKCTAEQTCILDNGEKKLDLFNLVVIRQRIELEVGDYGGNNTTDLLDGYMENFLAKPEISNLYQYRKTLLSR